MSPMGTLHLLLPNEARRTAAGGGAEGGARADDRTHVRRMVPAFRALSWATPSGRDGWGGSGGFSQPSGRQPQRRCGHADPGAERAGVLLSPRPQERVRDRRQAAEAGQAAADRAQPWRGGRGARGAWGWGVLGGRRLALRMRPAGERGATTAGQRSRFRQRAGVGERGEGEQRPLRDDARTPAREARATGGEGAAVFRGGRGAGGERMSSCPTRSRSETVTWATAGRGIACSRPTGCREIRARRGS